MNKFFKVLIALNQDDSLKAVKAHFYDAGWMVQAYGNGLEGLAQAREEHFDLLICSMALPVVTGIELVRALRNFSVNKTSPVIFLAEGTESTEHFNISARLKASIMTFQELIDKNVSNLESFHSPLESGQGAGEGLTNVLYYK